MNVLLLLVVGYFLGCAILSWCCCRVAANADERARQMRSRQRSTVQRLLQRNHHWFVRSEAPKLQLHLLRRTYRKDAKSPRGQDERQQRELLCDHIPDFPECKPEEPNPFRV